MILRGMDISVGDVAVKDGLASLVKWSALNIKDMILEDSFPVSY